VRRCHEHWESRSSLVERRASELRWHAVRRSSSTISGVLSRHGCNRRRPAAKNGGTERSILRNALGRWEVRATPDRLRSAPRTNTGHETLASTRTRPSLILTSRTIGRDTTKGGRFRAVPIVAEFRPFLEAHLKGLSGEHLFPTYRSLKGVRQIIQRDLKYAKVRAGLSPRL
jgi:hypothetical protein